MHNCAAKRIRILASAVVSIIECRVKNLRSAKSVILVHLALRVILRLVAACFHKYDFQRVAFSLSFLSRTRNLHP